MKNGGDHIKLNLTGGIMGPAWDRHWHSFFTESDWLPEQDKVGISAVLLALGTQGIADDSLSCTEPVNRYPLVIEQQDGTAVVGGGAGP